jgi:hypothetical protein
MHGSIGRSQETGSYGGGSGVHGKAPLKQASGSGLPLDVERNGADEARSRSDEMRDPEIVTLGRS